MLVMDVLKELSALNIEKTNIRQIPRSYEVVQRNKKRY